MEQTIPDTRYFTAVSRKTQRKLFLGALVISDVLALALASTFAYGIRFVVGIDLFEESMPTVDLYLRFTVLLVVLWILIFQRFQLYNMQYLLGGTDEYARVLNACTLAIMVVIAATFFGKIVIARGWLVLFWLFTVSWVGLLRFSMRRVAYGLRRLGYLRITALIVGADEEGKAIANQLHSTPTCGAEVIGFLDDRYTVGKSVDGLAVLGSVGQLAQIVDARRVEEVLISTSALTRQQVTDIYQLYGTSSQIELRLSPGLFEILTTGARVKEWGFVPLVSLNKVRLSELEMWIKSAMDYAVSAVGLLLVGPALLIIAMMIKFDSPGPIIFRRRVMGRGGTLFDAYKFRTMYVNGEEILDRHPEMRQEFQTILKLKDDPRVTRIGRFLRKYSLDELPQLLNVLFGQMSLVGPRMISPEEGEKYDKWKMNLLTVKPGITGMWQISGRSDVSFQERVRLDMQYIRNYSFWLDFMILFRTIPVVLSGHGAY